MDKIEQAYRIVAGVEWFGAQMEKVLLKPSNMDLGGWDYRGADQDLVGNLLDQALHLEKQVVFTESDGPSDPRYRIAKAVDIANYAFLIAERARREILAKAQKEAGQLELPGIS